LTAPMRIPALVRRSITREARERAGPGRRPSQARAAGDLRPARGRGGGAPEAPAPVATAARGCPPSATRHHHSGIFGAPPPPGAPHDAGAGGLQANPYADGRPAGSGARAGAAARRTPRGGCVVRCPATPPRGCSWVGIVGGRRRIGLRVPRGPLANGPERPAPGWPAGSTPRTLETSIVVFAILAERIDDKEGEQQCGTVSRPFVELDTEDRPMGSGQLTNLDWDY